MSTERAVRLVGPEGVPLTFELASVMERAFAFTIDIVAVMFASVLLIFPAIFVGAVSEDAGAVVFLLGLFVVRYFYFFFFESLWRGATPGKRIFELRVIARDGGRLGIDAIFARNLMRDLELFLPMAAWLAPESLVGHSPAWMWMPAVGWIVVVGALPFFTKERVRTGDVIGGTRVVRVPKTALLVDEAGGFSAFGPTLVFTDRHLSVYGEHELETLATVLRSSLDGKLELDDLRMLASTIAAKIRFQGKEHTEDPIRFLRAFYAQQRYALEQSLIFGYRKADKHDTDYKT